MRISLWLKLTAIFVTITLIVAVVMFVAVNRSVVSLLPSPRRSAPLPPLRRP